MSWSSRLFNRLFSSNSEPNIPLISSDQLPEDGELSVQWFQHLFEGCADIRISNLQIEPDDPSNTVIFIMCEGMSDVKLINQYVIPRLMNSQSERRNASLQSVVELELTRIDQVNQIITKVFAGYLIIYHVKRQELFSFDASDLPDRQPEESNTELSIKGPRDGFVENLNTNVALVRKRLRTNALRYDQYILGQKSHNRVALLYIKDYIRPDILAEVKKRIQNIKMDSLLSSAQLEELIADSPLSLFPLITYTGRPDFVVDCLLRGRFAIIVDGAPIAIIAPVNLTLLLKSPEDSYFPAHIVSFQMSIRLFGLFIALLLPGFWIALTSYNMEQIPYPLLATVVNTRMGLPLPSPLEAFMMLALFEIFREAAIRLPKAVGQTVAVVGGIIVGDAVIRAGLASTLMLIVSALTAVATFTLVNQSLSNAVSINRGIMMLGASLLGMYGFILSAIAILIYLSKLESFGVPYLSPISPLKPKHLVAAIFKRKLDSYDGTTFLNDPDNRKSGERT